MSQATSIQLPVPVGSLESYIQAVSRIPIMTVEQERELAKELQDENNLDAAQRMVFSHLRFVVHIARGYSGYGLPQADLIQEGNIGLMKAVKRFDPSHNVRLVSFAVHWIRAEIHEYILKNWRILKVATTKAQRKLFFNLRSSKKRLGWFNKDEVEAVAHDLGVSTKDVLEMESRLTNHDVTFDRGNDDSDDSKAALFSPSAYLYDSESDPARQIENSDWKADSDGKLIDALTLLDDRSRHIVKARWLTEDKATLQELADEYGVSAERIRQLEKNAMKKLKGVLTA